MADGAKLSSFVGGPFDVRAVMADIRPEAKDGFLLGEVPWEHFPQGSDVREALDLLHTGDSPGRTGTGVVSGLCANDMRAAAVLAVPFLIRIAADTRHRHRAQALAEVSCPARACYFGVASRDQLLLHRAKTYDNLYDGYGVEVTGYPAGWSIAAARAAITADIAILRPLLDDPDPTVRIRAAYVLATAADPERGVRAAFRSRLAAEQDPIVRAALVLATAESTRAHPHPATTDWIGELWRDRTQAPEVRLAAATRAHPHPATTDWIGELWRDRTQAPEVRLAAAIGWLCLTDEPAPDDLRATVDDLGSVSLVIAVPR
ncbi:HEAT repeat domain-containing protein [Streptomyces sp. CG 926]|uniref:HEAT repeat domain-containing protein n=1 Tax=Streptomyces sp. CG 926 TaxID=1882405 RepID=UPI00215A4EC0|nr:HEAT repeat domain-containing protein [Streptomyces sp. CG 926]